MGCETFEVGWNDVEDSRKQGRAQERITVTRGKVYCSVKQNKIT